MATMTRIKKSDSHVPTSVEELDRWVGLIGTAQSQIDTLETAAEGEIRAIRERLRRETKKAREGRNSLMTGIFTFASANRARLTGDGKTVRLTNGSISWRWTPPALAVDDDAAFPELLHRRGLDEFIRLKEEVNREAL